MRTARTILSSGLLAGFLVIACGQAPTGTAPAELGPKEGEVRGTVDGSTYVGTGWFSMTPDVRMGWGGEFQFSSSGVGSSVGERIYGVWSEGEIPPPGTYPITIPGPIQRDAWLFYTRETGSRKDLYAAYAGSLEIVSSSVEEVRGTFEAEVWLRCTLPTLTCPDLDGRVPESPETIELSGDFRFVPLDASFVSLDGTP